MENRGNLYILVDIKLVNGEIVMLSFYRYKFNNYK